MANLTYRKLGELIAQMSEENKDCDVTMYDPDVQEYFMLTQFGFVPDEHSDMLEVGHPYLKLIEEGDTD